MAQTEIGEFSLIVTEVDAARLADAAKKFARAFSLDEGIAHQVCASAPIIFAQKLTKAEVKAITPKLAELSADGIEFRITARVAGRIPKVNWPVRPQFTAGDSGGPNGLAFDWQNTAFVCPGCGESFLFRRMGKLKFENGSEDASRAQTRRASASRVSTEPVEAMAAASASGSESRPLAFSDDTPIRVEGVEGVQPLAGEGESLDLPDSVEEVSLEALAEEPEAPMTAEAVPAEEEGEAPESADEPAAEAVSDEAPPDGTELYNVFLSKITDTSKRDKASELIAGIKGCSTHEAKELTTRLVIPLAKNVAKEKAEGILDSFKKLKIFGRMTKVR